MLFCPTCANSLLVEQGDMNEMRFFCQTCPYIYPIASNVSKNIQVKKKEVDDVLGGDEAWANVDQTDAECPKCDNKKAYFMQIQIRSADEPMSIFFKCTNSKCNHQWREG